MLPTRNEERLARLMNCYDQMEGMIGGPESKADF